MWPAWINQPPASSVSDYKQVRYIWWKSVSVQIYNICTNDFALYFFTSKYAAKISNYQQTFSSKQSKVPQVGWSREMENNGIEFQEEEYLNVVIFHFSMSRASIPT